jgi:carbamoyltransferase
MLTIGFTGGMNAVHETTYPYPSFIAHDASAFLIHDGKVVAPVEQERLDRIKHSNKRCGEAIHRC